MEDNIITKKYSLIYKIHSFLKGGKLKYNNSPSTNKTELVDVKIRVKEKLNNKQLLNLYKPLFKYEDKLDIYLHGSWADETNNSFSDIDDFVILHKSRFKNKKSFEKVCVLLNRVDMNFCRIDPLQHHGHWITSDEELNFYDNSFMPIQIMGEAKLIMGSHIIKAKVDNVLTKINTKNNIINTCNSIQKLSSKLFNSSINLYELKCLVGSFVLIPAMLKQYQGSEMNKRDAIKVSVNMFSKNAYNCIEWSTNCRNNWDVISGKRSFQALKILSKLFTNPFIWRIFVSKYSPKASKKELLLLSYIQMSSIDVSCYIQESLKLLNE